MSIRLCLDTKWGVGCIVLIKDDVLFEVNLLAKGYSLKVCGLLFIDV